MTHSRKINFFCILIIAYLSLSLCGLFLNDFIFLIWEYFFGPYHTKIDLANGSGDTEFHIFRCLLFFSFSFIFAIVRSTLLFRNRTNVISNFVNMLLLLRFILAFVFINYGFAKLFGRQFGPPDLITLELKYGDSTPKILLGIFMGHSVFYYSVIGMFEIIIGLLLFFKRSFILGGLLSFLFSLNILMLNYCFNISAKLLSFHLVIFSLILISPFLVNIKRFLFDPSLVSLNGVLEDTIKLEPPITNPRKAILILLAFFIPLYINFINIKFVDYSKNLEVQGIYNIVNVSGSKSGINGRLNLHNSKEIIIGQDRVKIISEKYSNIYQYNFSREKHLFQINKDFEHIDFKITFVNDTLLLLENDQLQAYLMKRNVAEYRLLNSGFEIINENP